MRKNGLFSIENKIIGQKEIQTLADLIWKEYQQRNILARTSSFKSYVKCFEKVTYEDDGIKIFSNDSDIYKERIKSIEIIAKCDESLNIKLRLNHGQIKNDGIYVSDSDIEIGGDNFEKIHDIQARITKEIKSLPEQNIFFIKNHRRISKLVFIIGVLSFGFIIDLLYNDTKNRTPYWRRALVDIESFVGLSALATLFGGLILYSLYDNIIEKFRDYWPIVELDLGPEHFRPEVKRRKYLTLFITLILTPILVTFIYDLFKIFLYLLR